MSFFGVQIEVKAPPRAAQDSQGGPANQTSQLTVLHGFIVGMKPQSGTIRWAFNAMCRSNSSVASVVSEFLSSWVYFHSLGDKGASTRADCTLLLLGLT